MSDAESNRRPIKTRSSVWAQKTSSFLVRRNVSPNQISVASVFFAVIGGILLVCYPIPVGLLGCAVSIQGRLLCNLLDGMVAMEGGRQSPLGQMYNEFPDRIADSVLIIALGYTIHLPSIGWVGALGAALTAYVRIFGGSIGLPQDFRGPMAKQHRMAVMTGGCLIGAIELASFGTMYALIASSFAIAVGSFVTCITRSHVIAIKLKQSKL